MIGRSVWKVWHLTAGLLLGIVPATLAVEPAPRAPVKSASDVVIFRGQYPGWPWIDRTPGGKLVCVWREGTRTWSPPRPICDLHARTRSAPIKLSTGELVIPFYRAPGDQSLLALSNDDGQTWQIVEIANHPGFVGDEWDLAELPDGRLVGIIRNSAPKNDGTFYKIESRDRGRTWSKAARTNLRDTRSTSPAQIFVQQGKPVVLYADARMVSVSMATTDDPELLHWNLGDRLHCYQYRQDGTPISDGSYPVSVSVGDRRRLIVDYVHDNDLHAVAGYFVELPEAWFGK
jgi:hypothetical protein